MSAKQQFHVGKVAPLDVNNVDTDQIIPKQFLTSVSREGFGEALFYDWRYLDDGAPDPEFVLNEQRYQGASVLLSRDNFGCGSSREHAPWALKQYGFEVIVASSFADIFFNNCINNQMLPLKLTEAQVERLFGLATQEAPVQMEVDLKSQEVCVAGETFAFEIDPAIKERLLSGLDFIGITEQFMAQIEAFEQNGGRDAAWR